jgi:hypothetical protein
MEMKAGPASGEDFPRAHTGRTENRADAGDVSGKGVTR